MTRFIALCKIIETGSFTRAADVLGYTQAAVSQMIKSLEEEYGVSLIVRMRSGIKLTPEGEVLFPIINSIVSGYNLLGERANDLFSLDDGEVKIGALPSVSQNILPTLIKKFIGKYPGIRFVLNQGCNGELSEMLRHGKIDFALMHPTDQSGMKYEFIMTEEYRAVVGFNHPLSGRKSLRFEDLADEPIILVEDGNNLSDFGKLSDIKFTVCDSTAALAMVSEEIGIGIIPAYAIRLCESEKFVAIPLEPEVSYEIGICFRNEIPLSSAARKFADFVIGNL